LTPFLEILYELSHETGLKLYPDEHAACKLLVGDDMQIQLEMDPSGEKLFIVSLLAELPLGRFRENVLKHALVANSTEPPSYGYLCYVHQINHLALYAALTAEGLKGPFLVEYLASFYDKAKKWKQAIHAGQPGPNVLSSTKESPPRPGIKP